MPNIILEVQIMDAEKRREKELQKELAKLDLEDEEFFKEVELDDDDIVFHGRVADLEKVRQFQNLCLAAQLLRKKSEDVEKILFLDPSPSEADGHVALTCHRPLFLHGEARLAFAFLGAYADEIYVNCFNDGPIRITFVVSGVWKE